MRIRYLLLFGCLFATQLALASGPTSPPSKITDVTVFLRGAQVSREARVTVHKGDNVIQFKGLASGIDARSIQAAAPPVVIINSVSHEVNYLQTQQPPRRVMLQQDSLELLKEQLERIKKEDLVLDLEKKMLLKNQSISGKETGLSIDELERAADFFRQRMTNINQIILKNQQKTQKIKLHTKQINQQLRVWNYKKKQPSNDIIVKIHSEYDRTITLHIRYLVEEAGWIPRYDLRAKDTQGPIQLEYNADVYQNTGIDWKHVQLTLSSGDPNQGGTKPELGQWNLYTGNPAYQNTRNASGYTETLSKESRKFEDKKDVSNMDDEEGMTLADYTTVSQGAVTSEFSISIPQDIPSTGQKEQVSIQNSELAALFQHYAVPKLDKDAFLVARVTGWENLNLLSGPVNIFFEGTYVTEAYLDAEITSDTLDFSLGRDKKVVIQRELLKDYNKRRSIGANRVRTFGYEITVRNTKSTPIHLQLLDQVPVSQDERITIKAIELSKAAHNEATGKLTWDLDLQPASTQKLKLIFSVKYPKKSIVPGI